jgi:hypothetical protein
MDIFNNTRKLFRAVGFDAGEQIQVATAFLAVRNKWMKNNPKIAHEWMKDQNLSRISSEAREISFNMNKAGMMAFQKGGFGMMFQFLSHMTKATQVLIPQKAFGKTIGKLSNKAFSDKEKARIALIQFSLYGTGAFGLHSAFEKLFAEVEGTTGDIAPPEFVDAVNQGLTGTLLSITLGAALDEDGPLQTNVDFSGNFGPFSGIFSERDVFGNPLGAILSSIVLTPTTALEILTGPAYDLGKSAYTAANFTGAVLGYHKDLGELPSGDDAIIMFDEWGRQFLPIYNNFIRGRAEDAMNRFISNAGEMGVEMTEGEAFARRWLGVAPVRQRQVQGEMMRLQGLMGHPKKDAIEADLRDTAKQYYKWAMRKVEQAQDGKTDPISVANEVFSMAQGLKMVLDDSEYRFLFDKALRNEIANDLSDGGTEFKLVTSLLNLFHDGAPTLYDPDYIERLRNMTDWAGKDEIVNRIEELKGLANGRTSN